MSECPVCGKSFKSERGLRVHMARVHGQKMEEKPKEISLDKWM